MRLLAARSPADFSRSPDVAGNGLKTSQGRMN